MNPLTIVMYHYVRPIKDSEYPEIKGLELDLFKEQLDFFQDNFNVVTMESVIDSLNGKCKLPEKPMLLTFDDGYKDHYEYVFPELKKRGMQGSFYVPSGILKNKKVLDVNKIHFILACSEIDDLLQEVKGMLEKYGKLGYEIESYETMFKRLAIANRWDKKEVIFVKRLLQTYLEEELRGKIVDELFVKIVGVSEEEFSEKLYVSMDDIIEMKKGGMFFGLHGDRHYWLNQLPEDKMKEDIDNGLSFFEAVIDKDYIVMNYPYGGYNEEVLSYCKSIGCKLGFSVEARQVDMDLDNPMKYPRLDTNDFPPKSENYVNILVENG